LFAARVDQCGRDDSVKIDVNGVQLAYEERGAGMPLVLLHGFPFTRQMWERQITGLANRYRVIAPDLRGFGESSGTPSTVEELADDLHVLIEHLGRHLELPACVVAGFSMGGYVVFRYLALHGDRVKALILISTRAEADTPEGRESRYAAIERLRKEGAEKYLAEFARRLVSTQALDTDPGLVAKVRRFIGVPRVDSLSGALKAMAERPDSSPLLPTIAVPTLVVAGADDNVIPATVAREMAGKIKGAKCVVVRDAGHMVNIEQSDQFTAALREFLNSVPKT
jgi:pimeloyl-ACP methyl ester carboxylesterase